MLQYILLFLEGIITFISPCLLPMLPVYISYFASGQADKKNTLINAAGFVIGFSFVFAALGAFAGSIGRLLTEHQSLLNIICGLAVVIFGLNFLGVISIGFINRAGSRTAKIKEPGLLSSVLFGMIFSVSWTPCVSAFLGSALMKASSSGSAAEGAVMLTVFSLGLGLPLIISALLIDRLKSTFDFIKRNFRAVNIISGSLLIITGFLMMTGSMSRIMLLFA